MIKSINRIFLLGYITILVILLSLTNQETNLLQNKEQKYNLQNIEHEKPKIDMDRIRKLETKEHSITIIVTGNKNETFLSHKGLPVIKIFVNDKEGELLPGGYYTILTKDGEN